MGLSSRFDLSVHVLCVLALFDGRDVPSAFVATSLNTNPVSVRRLLGLLKAAGMVQTREGVEGGYCLARRPEAIALDEVYAAVEPGPLFGTHTTPPSSHCPIGRGIQPAMASLHAEAERELMAALAKHTIGEALLGMTSAEERALAAGCSPWKGLEPAAN